MKSYKIFSILMVFVIVAGSFTFASAAPALQEDEPVVSYDTDSLDVYMPSQAELDAQAKNANYIPGEFIVNVAVKNDKVSVSADMMASTVQAMGGMVAQTSIAGNSYLVKFKDGVDAQEVINSLSAVDGVIYVQQNAVVSIPNLPEKLDKDGNIVAQEMELIDVDAKDMAPYVDNSFDLGGDYSTELYAPNDSLRGYQWYWSKVMTMISPAPAGVTPCVVVIDTGVDYTHVDLDGKTYRGYDYIDMDAYPMDENGHGTHVAGIAAAETGNSTGIAGASPSSKILAIRVLDENGSGSNWAVTEGIKYANQSGSTRCGGQVPKVYNMSLGSASYSYDMAAAVAAANNMGRLVVAAAGNDNVTTKFYPAAYPNVFAVGATDQNDYRTYFSNYDTVAAPWVDIAAPGYYMWSTYYDYDSNPSTMTYTTMNGTSMASPLVAGLAARVWAKYPGYTANQVASRLISTGDPAYGFLRGAITRVDLSRAMGVTNRFIQGMVLDEYGDAESGVTVTVKRYATGATVCTLTTNDTGFYTCSGLPSVGKYAVSITKAGYVTNQQAFYVGYRKFNSLFAIMPTYGNTGDFNWIVSVQWPAWQPYTSVAYDLDFYAWNSTTGTCYTSDVSADDQVGYIAISSTTDNVYQVHARNYGGGYEAASRITASKAQARIYRNNWMMRFINVPTTPTTTGTDNWYLININTVNNQYLYRNQVYTTWTGCTW